MRIRTLIVALLVPTFTAALLVAVPATASASTFTVNSSLDTGDANLSDGVCATAGGVCTLRAAVQQANTSVAVDQITVPAMRIQLSGELTISTSMQIRGAGARATVVSATSGHRNIYVTNGNVEISDLAIQDIVTTAAYGSAIHQVGGTVNVTRVRVSNIKVTTTSVMAYGPILAEWGIMTISDSEISGNTITTTSNNVFGAGVTTGNAATSSMVRIVNSTIANNSAVTSGVGAYWAMGGGVYGGSNQSIEIESSTIAGNSATNTSDGAYGIGGNVLSQTGVSATGSFTVSNSILAGGSDTSSSGGNCYPASSSIRTIAMTGRNLVDDSTCGAAAAQRTIGAAHLLPLGNYGGPTNTEPPGAGSPALNAASACVTPLDQRGQGRPIGGACDLGSTELGASVAVSAALSNTSPTPGGDVVLTLTVSNGGLDTTTGTKVTVTMDGGSLLTLPPGCSAGGNGASCPLPDLPFGASGQVMLPARAPLTGTATVQVSVTSDQPDPQPADNTATVQATVPATTPPTPVVALPGGSVSLSSAIGVRWSGAGVVTGFQVQRALKRPGRALGGYADWRSLPAAATSTTMTGGVPGYAYCFRVRALGSGGGASAWSAPRCSTMPSDDRALAARRGWVRSTTKTAYLRTLTSSRVRGATLTLAASRGSMLALVVAKAPGGGTLGLYVRGKRVAVVATTARRAAARAVVAVRVRTSGYPLVLRVDAPGTRGVTIDGIAQLP